MKSSTASSPSNAPAATTAFDKLWESPVAWHLLRRYATAAQIRDAGPQACQHDWQDVAERLWTAAVAVLNLLQLLVERLGLGGVFARRQCRQQVIVGDLVMDLARSFSQTNFVGMSYSNSVPAGLLAPG